MLVYEPERTESIVSRLVAIGNAVRNRTIVTYILVLGIGFSVGALVIEPDLWWVGSLIGAVVGFVAGTMSVSLMVVAVEWMAQMLVVQESILAELRKR